MAEDSEFGGAPGLIQPAPHSVLTSAREQAFLERATDPSPDLVTGAATDSPAQVLADVLSGKYPRVPLPEAAEISPLQPDVIFVATGNPSTGLLQFVGVGNQDLRTARLKVSEQPTMYPSTFGPEKEVPVSIAPVIQLEMGSLAPGHYFYQVLMNNLQVTQVWEVDVV